MNEHRQYHAWMHARLDGDLDPADRQQLDAHLAGCEACAAAWHGLREAHRRLAGQPLAAPRPGFTGRFNARLAQRRARPRLVWGGVALGLGAVGASAVILPLGLALFISVLRGAQQPATALALTNSLDAATALLTTVADALIIAVRALVAAAAPNPMVWAGLLLALAATVAWFYALRKLVLLGAPR